MDILITKIAGGFTIEEKVPFTQNGPSVGQAKRKFPGPGADEWGIMPIEALLSRIEWIRTYVAASLNISFSGLDDVEVRMLKVEFGPNPKPIKITTTITREQAAECVSIVGIAGDDRSLAPELFAHFLEVFDIKETEEFAIECGFQVFEIWDVAPLTFPIPID